MSFVKPILDTLLPIWLHDLRVNSLPPKADATIRLLDRLIHEVGASEWAIGLQMWDRSLDPLSLLLKKLGLCLPAHMSRLWCNSFYTRDNLVYCGYCDDEAAAGNPLTLPDATYHMRDFHRHQVFKIGMLRLPPKGEVFDGHCKDCGVPVLAEARGNESKSGVECKSCHQKCCFDCMDDSLWFGGEAYNFSISVKKGDLTFLIRLITLGSGACYICDGCRRNYDVALVGF